MGKTFRYKTIEDEIRRRIETGIYPEASFLGSTEELAREFDASIITINKAVRELVGLGYIERTPRRGSCVTPRGQWNNGASQRRKSGLVGAIVFDSSSPYLWAKAIYGMESGLREHGYNLVIGNDDGSIKKARNYVKELSEKGIEGLIVVPIGMSSRKEYEEANKPLLEDMRTAGIPFVFFHRFVETENASSVVIENYLDSRRVVEILLAEGVRNPVCVSHYYDSVIEERENGFRDALLAAGFDRPETRILRVHPAGQTIAELDRVDIGTALHDAREVDGIFALSAALLTRTMEAVQSDARLSGRQIRYAGFDYTEQLFGDPQVVVLAEPPAFELGKVAADSLASLIKTGSSLNARISLRSRIHRK
jgi:LacI family transcriptional regulator